MENLRVSKWDFETSAGMTINLGSTAFAGGMISLKDPDNQTHHLHFGALGAGFGVGARLTRIDVPDTLARNYDLSGSGSTKDFYSAGDVFMTKAFKGNELSLADIQGAAIYVDASISMIASGAYDLMFLGIDPVFVEAVVLTPAFKWGVINIAINEAKSVLLMRSLSMGPQVGMGINGMVGLLH